MDPFVCRTCNKKFIRVSSFRTHVSITHSKRIFVCHHCTRVFKAKHYLIRHQQSMEACQDYIARKRPFNVFIEQTITGGASKPKIPREKWLPCNVCFKKFADHDLLRRHLKLHGNAIRKCVAHF